MQQILKECDILILNKLIMEAQQSIPIFSEISGPVLLFPEAELHGGRGITYFTYCSIHGLA